MDRHLTAVSALKRDELDETLLHILPSTFAIYTVQNHYTIITLVGGERDGHVDRTQRESDCRGEGGGEQRQQL